MKFNRRFNITGEMGSVEVFFGSQQMRWYEECKTDEERRQFVAHEAWRKLFDSPAKKMLEDLCNKLGTTVVKNKFSANIQIEEIS